MRTEGGDFFCGLTFPIGKQSCTFVCGGWGGTVVGLSCVDGFDASEGTTSRSITFKDNQWYHIRIRVTEQQLEAWIDDELILEQELADHRFAVRLEVEPCVPLGIATWNTGSAIRNIKFRKLD
jgi:hypothetical protein